jgi:F0F1-type ATP synthase alpha subunit
MIPAQSVTRVGRRTQSTLATQLSIRAQALLAEQERQQRYSQFGTQLSQKTRRLITQGQVMRALLNQEQMTALSPEAQIVLLALVFTGLFDGKDAAFAAKNRRALVEAVARAPQNAAVAPVVESAQRGTISLEQFLKKLSGAVPYFAAVCR